MRTVPSSFAMLLVLSVATATPAAAGTIIEVPVDRPTIQAAIDLASSGDTILVAPGTYSERIRFLGKDLEILSSDGPGVTSIVGNGNGSVVSFLDGEGPGAILDGFTITGGGGTRRNGSEYGGGIVGRDASPTLRNNVITNNQATVGAGMAFGGGSPLIENNVIEANTALELASPQEILGAGLAFFAGSPTVIGNRIEGNLIFDAGGRMGFGAGIYARRVQEASFLDNEILGNRHDPRVDVEGGGFYFIGPGSASVTGNRIESNEACNGGGIFVQELDLAIDGNQFRFNAARCDLDTTGFGGGVSVLRCDLVEIRSTLFLENEASLGGGGVSVSSSSASVENTVVTRNRAIKGAGVFAALGVGVRMTNCTIVRNELMDADDAEGAGIYIDRNASSLANGIARDNVDSSGLDSDIAGDLDDVTFSNVSGGYPGEGNIDLPSMLEVAADDWIHLQSGAPEVDAGSNDVPGLPASDGDGDERILDGDGDGIARVDMGADELRREIAVRYGNVIGGMFGDVVSVLTINDSIGDRDRVVQAGSMEISIDIALPPAGGDGRFVVHGNEGEPSLGSLRVLPRGIGTIGFPLLLPEATPIAVWNSIGKESFLGESRVFSVPIPAPSPAPTELLDTASGGTFSVPPGTVLTFQGVIVDPASDAAAPVSVTNAVVLLVE